jgi:serine protease
MSNQSRFLLLLSLLLLLVGCGGESPPSLTESTSQTAAALTESRRVTFTLPAGVEFAQVALGANGSLKIDDRAQVLTPTGFALSTNAGTAVGAASTYGTDTKVGSITSNPAVALRDRTRVTGAVVSGKTVTPGNSVVVTGTTTQNAVLTPVQQLSWNVVLQLGTQDVTVAGGTSRTLTPGAYRNVVDSVNGALTLNGAGVYSFDTLDLQPGSTLTLNAGTGAITIYVRNSLVYRGTVTGAPAENVMLVYLASTPVFLESTFNGTLIAPNASMRLATGNSTHSGAVLARDVELDPGAKFTGRPFSKWSQVPLNVIPTFNCVDHRSFDGKYAAVLGYYNPNAQAVAVAAGPDNTVDPAPGDRGQPTTFLPGRFGNELSIDFGAAPSLTWTLQGTPLTVARTATACPSSTTVSLLADATVSEATPKANFGADTRLNVGPGVHALVRFDRDAVKKALGNGRYVARATLEFTKTAGTQPALEAFMMASSKWTEAGATWNCAVDVDTSGTGETCAAGTRWKVARGEYHEAAEIPPWRKRGSGRNVSGAWGGGKVSFDVTRDVQQMLGVEGFRRGASWVVALALGDGTSTTQFGSKEAVTGKPRLLLELTSVGDTSVGGRGVLTFKVDPTLLPRAAQAQPLPDGTPRPWVGFEDAAGRHSDFVDQELVAHVSTAAEATAIANRWGGTVTRLVPPPATDPGLKTMATIRVDATRGNTLALAGRLRGIDSRPGGVHRLTTATGLGTLAIAAEEGLAGSGVQLNWLAEPTLPPTAQAWVSRTIVEGAPFSPFPRPFPDAPIPGSNPFQWAGFSSCNRVPSPIHPGEFVCSTLFPGGESIWQHFAVADAWRALALTGKLLPGSVKVGIADLGWSLSADPDYPKNFVNDVLNPSHSNVQALHPWHGDIVVRAGFGVPGNAFGGAGPGGPVADLELLSLYVDESSKMEEGIRYLRGQGNRAVNVSATYTVLDVGTLFVGIDTSGQWSNVPLFASAGNNGIDVDYEDCVWGICHEVESIEPCENDGVLCIGGLGYNSEARYNGGIVDGALLASAFGSDGSVDYAGPWYPHVSVGANAQPVSPLVPEFAVKPGGTSSASPYMAGIAALIAAADPARSDDDMRVCLAAGATRVPFGLTGDGSETRLPDALKSVTCMALGSCIEPATFANILSFSHCDPGGNFPPALKINFPENGATIGRGTLVSVNATATDYENGNLFVSWTSDKDGPRGTTFSDTTGLLSFNTLGAHTLTASISDGTTTVQASVTINVVAAPPTVTIVHPVDGAHVPQGVPVRFSATVSAAGLGIAAPSPTAFVWNGAGTSSGPDFSGLNGSTINPVFSVPGVHLVSVTFTDVYGEATTDEVQIVVDDSASTPATEIVLPAPDSGGTIILEAGVAATLLAQSNFSVTQYTWVVRINGSIVATLFGNNLAWDPDTVTNLSCHAKPATLELTAADATTGLSATDAVAVWIFPPGLGGTCTP